MALHHSPNRVLNRGFDAIAAVYVANLLAHRIEPNQAADPETDLEHCEQDLAALGVLDQLGDWQNMMADIPSLMSQADARAA